MFCREKIRSCWQGNCWNYKLTFSWNREDTESFSAVYVALCSPNKFFGSADGWPAEVRQAGGAVRRKVLAG